MKADDLGAEDTGAPARKQEPLGEDEESARYVQLLLLLS